MVELADSLDSGSSAHYGRAGSSPASRTKKRETRKACLSFFGAQGDSARNRGSTHETLKIRAAGDGFLASRVRARARARSCPASCTRLARWFLIRNHRAFSILVDVYTVI